MDMRVKMILDLIARTGGGARKAKSDIKGVKDAAKGLDGAKGGQRLNRDFLNLASSSKAAARNVRETKTAANQLGTSSGPRKLGRDFLDLSRNARAAGREIDQVGRKATRAQAQAARAHATQPRKAAAGGGEAGKDGGTTLFGGTKALVGGYLGIQGARMAARATVGQSISFEKAMAEVRKKVDGMDDPAELQKMEQAVSKWAIAYGRAREEVASLVAEAGAGGVTLKDMPEFVRVNLAAATAWDVSADKAGNALAKIKAATGWGNKELELFVDKVNALSDAGAAKEMDVVDMFQRAGAAAKAAGVDFNMSLAFLTAMNNVAIAPEVAARGFNAFASTLRTATEQQDRVDEGLKMIGLSAKKVEKGMKTNATGTMIDVLERLEKHADKAKAAIKIFGKEWWDEVARAGQALPEIRKNIDIVTDPKKHVGSAQNSLNIELSTTDKHLKRLSALTSEVGDKLGRWALPAINEGIEKIIAGFDALEKRAADRAQERADRAAEDATAGRVAGDQPLTAEERERMATDAAYRKRVQEGAAGKRTDKANLGLTNNLRLSELEQERASLGTSIENRRRVGATDEQLAYSVNRLAAIVEQIRAIDPSRVPAAVDPRRPADQDDRANPGRGEAVALLERVKRLEAKLAATQELAAASSNPADRKGFESDAIRVGTRLGSARRPGGQFGFGPGGAPISAQPKGAGPATSSFGLSVKDWAKSLIGAGDIDLGGAGITIAESLASGLRQGGASAESAASGIRSGITGAFDGADLSGAGAAMMGSLERGITAGGDRAVAAAQRVAARVKAATASGTAGGGSGRLGGALHDGVE
ncbi:phage tail tape measure protein [Bosea thiooxidans]